MQRAVPPETALLLLAGLPAECSARPETAASQIHTPPHMMHTFPLGEAGTVEIETIELHDGIR